MSPNLDHPPFHLGRHRRTISARTLDTVLENSISPCSPSSRPSTASTQASFSTAYTTLEAGSCFRYYLPHISTEDSSVYTRNDSYACNLSPITPHKSLPPVDFGRFYHYIPDQSSEEDDVYTDGRNVMFDTLRGHGIMDVRPEQKVLGEFKGVNFDSTPTDIESPMSFIGPKEFPYRPSIHVTEAVDVDVDVGSYTAGERLGTTVVVDAVEKKRNMLGKEKHRRSMSLADMSWKVKEMLRKLDLGKRPKGRRYR